MEEKDDKKTEPTSVVVVGEVDSEQRQLKVKAELEAVKGERDEMTNLLRTKDETIKHMEEEILPFVRAWCQEQLKQD